MVANRIFICLISHKSSNGISKIDKRMLTSINSYRLKLIHKLTDTLKIIYFMFKSNINSKLLNSYVLVLLKIAINIINITLKNIDLVFP